MGLRARALLGLFGAVSHAAWRAGALNALAELGGVRRLRRVLRRVRLRASGAKLGTGEKRQTQATKRCCARLRGFIRHDGQAGMLTLTVVMLLSTSSATLLASASSPCTRLASDAKYRPYTCVQAPSKQGATPDIIHRHRLGPRSPPLGVCAVRFSAGLAVPCARGLAAGGLASPPDLRLPLRC